MQQQLIMELPIQPDQDRQPESHGTLVLVSLWDKAEQEVTLQRQPRVIPRQPVPAEKATVRYDHD
ncbi:MAG: hypothetical protein AB7G75_10985 [Candidatus Binatia bacterium]